MSIGERLKQARKLKGMTQEELALKIGASRGVITNIEHNKISEPQPMIINALCNSLDINKNWLLDGTGTMKINQDIQKSAIVLSEIYANVKELSEPEQVYILDLIKSYKNLAVKTKESE